MNELKTDLESLLVRINEQIEVIEKYCEKTGTDPLEVRLPDGQWVLPSLLLAKSNVVLAMSNIRPQVVINNHRGGKW